MRVTLAWTVLVAVSAQFIDSVSPRRGSTLGETPIIIAGGGFKTAEGSSPWDMQQVYIGTTPCDSIQSMCNETHIVCRTRPSFVGETEELQVAVVTFDPIGTASWAHGSPLAIFKE